MTRSLPRRRTLVSIAGALVLAAGCAKSAPVDDQAHPPPPTADQAHARPPADAAPAPPPPPLPAEDAACPEDLLAARGMPCAPDGKTCNAGARVGPRLLMCSRGTWTEMSVRPPPAGR